MGLDSLFWITVLIAVGLLLGVLPSFVDLRTTDNGKLRITRAGRIVLALTVVGLILSVATQQAAERKENREKISADSAALARTEAITGRLEAVLTETEAIRGESERLRELQRRALRQVDSVWIVSKELEAQQRTALGGLRLNLSLSAGIADSLQQIVVFSRQLVDSLRLAETRAAERAQTTLALVERRSNPVTTIAAPMHISFEPTNAVAKLVIDSVFSQHTRQQAIVNEFMVNVNGHVQPARLPTEIVFTFWRREDCQDPLAWERSILTARRAVSYADTERRFWTRGPDSLRSFSVRLEQSPLSITTSQGLSVDDLHGACVDVDLEWHGMLSDATRRLWDASTVSVYQFEFPNGRRAIVYPRARVKLQNDVELLRLPLAF